MLVAARLLSRRSLVGCYFAFSRHCSVRTWTPYINNVIQKASHLAASCVPPVLALFFAGRTLLTSHKRLRSEKMDT